MRKLITLILIFLMIGLSLVTFAYWGNNTFEDENTVLIGTGNEIEVNFSSEHDDKLLVPYIAKKGPNQVSEIISYYDVKYSSIPLTDMSLLISITNLMADNRKVSQDFLDIFIEWKIEESPWVVYDQSAPPSLYDSNTIRTINIRITVSFNLNNGPLNYRMIFQAGNGSVKYTVNFQALSTP